MKPDTPLYSAKQFTAKTVFGEFSASGTLCGSIDFTGPFKVTYALTPDEALLIINALKNARTDVLNNSDPIGDPRLIEKETALAEAIEQAEHKWVGLSVAQEVIMVEAARKHLNAKVDCAPVDELIAQMGVEFANDPNALSGCDIPLAYIRGMRFATEWLNGKRLLAVKEKAQERGEPKPAIQQFAEELREASSRPAVIITEVSTDGLKIECFNTGGAGEHPDAYQDEETKGGRS